jgi:hypothetical protein
MNFTVKLTLGALAFSMAALSSMAPAEAAGGLCRYRGVEVASVYSSPVGGAGNQAASYEYWVTIRARQAEGTEATISADGFPSNVRLIPNMSVSINRNGSTTFKLGTGPTALTPGSVRLLLDNDSNSGGPAVWVRNC